MLLLIYQSSFVALLVKTFVLVSLLLAVKAGLIWSLVLLLNPGESKVPPATISNWQMDERGEQAEQE